MRARVGHLLELVLHLSFGELSSAHRFTLLGWAWPLARQLAQLGVLVFLFSRVLHLGIADYPAFIFVGLLAWTWFATGVEAAAGAVIDRRHLVFQSRFPDALLPVIAVVVPFVDLLIALPVLVGLLAFEGDLAPRSLLVAPLLVVQLVLMCGLGWLFGAAAVYFRDLRNIVGVGLLIAFYVTPVFYDLSKVPHRYHWVLQLNPLTTLINGYRSVTLGRPGPSAVALVVVTAASAALAVVGLVAFRRLQGGFVDEL